MTTKYKVARRKLSLPLLDRQEANAPKAHRICGGRLQQAHKIQRSYHSYGAEG